MKKYINCKIYDLEYLKNKELTDEDLKNLFDTSSLYASLIIAMFRIIGDTRKNWQIMKMVRTENGWPDKYYMSKKQRTDFENELVEIFMNIYQYKEYAARQKSQWFLIYFGFQIKNN